MAFFLLIIRFITPANIPYESMKEEVLEILTDHGTLIEPDAVEFILSQKDPKAFIKNFLSDREALPLVLSLKDFRTTESVLSYTQKGSEETENTTRTDPLSPTPIDDASSKKEGTGTSDVIKDQAQLTSKADATTIREKKSGVVVITDITGNSTCEGKIINFARYFKDRYVTLSRIVRKWQRMRSVIPIVKALKLEDEIKIIGMINEINQTKNGHTRISIEDETGKMEALILKGSPCDNISLVADEVIGIIGKTKKSKGGYRGDDSVMLFPDDIVKPDIPVNRSPRRASEDVEVLFISDVHVGSKHFLEVEWNRFMAWLAEEDNVSKIRYMIIAGDTVDGIGVYPNQKDELTITDLMEQYAEFGRMLEKVPPHIEIIIQPGNHDAARPAEPQPALDDEIQGKFNPDLNIRFVGNPCYMTLEGVNVLSYHGRSVDDLIGDVPQLTYQTPILAMKEMLKRRHMAISYGGKTPIAPEDKDYMIINPVPDIFVTGHVHGSGVDNYRGVKLISASAWQSQTPFQAIHNFHPDPAKVVCVNLMTGKHKILDFTDPE